MNPPRRTATKWPSRWIFWLVLGVLGLLLGGVLHVYFSRIELAPAGEILLEADDPQSIVHARRLKAMLLLLLVAALLLLLFVMGVYLFNRLGRAVLAQPLGGKPTPYSDAWGSYRITDEQVQAATDEGVDEGQRGKQGRSRPDGESGLPPPDDDQAGDAASGADGGDGGDD